MYDDVEAVKLAEARYWDEHGYRFGAWQFLPETGEVRRNGALLHQLTPTHAGVLKDLVAAYPAYVPADSHGHLKLVVSRLRKQIGFAAIENVQVWGYRFNPTAVM